MRWTRAKLDTTKNRILAELESKFQDRSRPECLAYITSEIAELSDAIDGDRLLKRFYLCVFALVQHRRYGGLSDHQVNGLVELASAIVEVKGIAKQRSTIGDLLQELYTVLSQIQRNESRHLDATWTQLKANKKRGRSDGSFAGFGDYSLALRALRLGHRDLTLLDRAKNLGIPAVDAKVASLIEVKLARLEGNCTKANQLADTLIADLSSNQAVRDETSWEKLCIKAQTLGDPEGLVTAIRRKGSHYTDSYTIEACLWAYLCRESKWLKKIPSGFSIARRKGFEPKRAGFAFKALKVIEECYDPQIPVDTRIDRAMNIVSHIGDSLTVEHELLILSGVYRWLQRVSALDYAEFVYEEYQNLSLKLSGYKVSDILQLKLDSEAKLKSAS